MALRWRQASCHGVCEYPNILSERLQGGFDGRTQILLKTNPRAMTMTMTIGNLLQPREQNEDDDDHDEDNDADGNI